ncbi:MAG TPA: hypothetical protein VFK47_13715, partial [Ktedonobacteraceae bacterium]|nr:hypothetical protein [Ktedonobacteraceae bacterium]
LSKQHRNHPEDQHKQYRRLRAPYHQRTLLHSPCRKRNRLNPLKHPLHILQYRMRLRLLNKRHYFVINVVHALDQVSASVIIAVPNFLKKGLGIHCLAHNERFTRL